MDFTADSTGDDVADLLEVLKEVFDAVVGVVLAEEHGVVGDGVVDGYA